MTGLYKKRLEGVKPSKDLTELLSQSLKLAATTRDGSSSSAANDNDAAHNTSSEEEDLIIPTLTIDQAQEILSKWNNKNESSRVEEVAWIPISVIRAMEVVLLKDDSSSCTARDKLDRALIQSSSSSSSQKTPSSSLVFTPPPPVAQPTADQIKFQKRLERLRLQQEENEYKTATKNLGLTAPADDVTTRSMTYAASIGLNMIVAPLSFGMFMYFFSGGVLNFFSSSSSDDDDGANNNNAEDDFSQQVAPHYTGPDIKRVILAVISGVAMMFIEMLLFVIRTHEMDKAMRKKSKKKKHGAFGEYSSKMNKTYQDKYK